MIEQPFAVPDNHSASAPGKMCGHECCNLHVGQRSFAGFVSSRKMSREDYRVFLKIFRVKPAEETVPVEKKEEEKIEKKAEVQPKQPKQKRARLLGWSGLYSMGY